MRLGSFQNLYLSFAIVEITHGVTVNRDDTDFPHAKPQILYHESDVDMDSASEDSASEEDNQPSTSKHIAPRRANVASKNTNGGSADNDWE